MQITWTDDHRVAPLLQSMAKRPPAQESYAGYSDSSWGNKTYWRYTGQRFRELCAIREEYIDRAWSHEETQPEAFRAALQAPEAADLVNYVLGKYIYTHFDGRTDFPSRDEYLAQCAATMPDLAPGQLQMLADAQASRLAVAA